MAHNIFQGDDIDPGSPGLSTINAAVPHRMSWADIRDNTLLYLNGSETRADFERWTQRFVTAGEEDTYILEKIAEETSSFDQADVCEKLVEAIKKSTKGFLEARNELIKAVEGGKKKSAVLPLARSFLSAFNSYYPNVPDLGQHRGINIQVSNRPHSNIDEEGSKSPMTEQLWMMTPHRLSEFPLDSTGENLVTTSGHPYPLKAMEDDDTDFLNTVGTKNIKAKPMDFDKGGTGWT